MQGTSLAWRGEWMGQPEEAGLGQLGHAGEPGGEGGGRRLQWHSGGDVRCVWPPAAQRCTPAAPSFTAQSPMTLSKETLSVPHPCSMGMRNKRLQLCPLFALLASLPSPTHTNSSLAACMQCSPPPTHTRTHPTASLPPLLPYAGVRGPDAWQGGPGLPQCHAVPPLVLQGRGVQAVRYNVQRDV